MLLRGSEVGPFLVELLHLHELGWREGLLAGGGEGIVDLGVALGELLKLLLLRGLLGLAEGLQLLQELVNLLNTSVVKLAVVEVGNLLLKPGGEWSGLGLVLVLGTGLITESGAQATKVGKGNITQLLRGKGQLLLYLGEREREEEKR